MSSLANWTYLATLTIWPAGGYDELGRPIGGTPYTIMGDWQAGGDLSVDADGIQFAPKSTYYFEAEDGSSLVPEPDWHILRGDHASLGTPPPEAERIRSVTGWNMAMFGDELPDWRVQT